MFRVLDEEARRILGASAGLAAFVELLMTPLQGGKIR